MLTERLKSAIPLLAIVCYAFFAPLWLGGWLFALLASAMLLLAGYEAFTLLAPNFKKRLMVVFTVLAELQMLAAILPSVVPSFLQRHFPGGAFTPCALRLVQTLPRLMPACAILAILLAFALTFGHEQDKATVHGVLAAIGASAFILWPLSYLVELYYMSYGVGYMSACNGAESRMLLFYLIAVTKMADVGAYFFGSQLAKRPGGNHRLSPLVSPKKSWEGLIGGTLFSLVTSLCFLACRHGAMYLYGRPVLSWADAVVIGIAASGIGLLGDLAESSLKRAAGAKDSGSLPGIGGILDTLDSLLPMGPLFYGYIMLKLAFI